MNKCINYGVTFFNGFAIVKKICTLNTTELNTIILQFPNLLTISKAFSRKGNQRLYRIESIMPNITYDEFWPALKLAMLRTKHSDLQHDIDIMQGIADNAERCLHDQTDPLPF
jgi:hypothetical protein